MVYELKCPCCGCLLSFDITEDGVAVRPGKINETMTTSAVVQLASELGIEIGVAEGGEKIG